MTKRKLLLFFFLLLAVIAVPVTVLLTQQEQDTRSSAKATTTLTFTPQSSQTSPIIKQVGEVFNLDLMLTPGTNRIALLRLEVLYDPTKLEPVNTSSKPAFEYNTQAFPNPLQNPKYNQGSITAALSVGIDPTKAISNPIKVGTLTFKTLANTENNVIQIKLSDKTKAYSSASTDSAGENVLLPVTPAFLRIGTTSDPTACDNVPTLAQQQNKLLYAANLTGAQEIPPTNSTATGKAYVLLDKDNDNPNGSVYVCFAGLSSDQTAAHIHSPGPVGQTAAAIITLPEDQVTNHAMSLTSTQLQQLNNGLMYINIHTQTFQNGEIRGQLALQSTGDPTPTSTPTPSGPTATPTITPTLAPGQTSFTFTLLLHGIGRGGDNKNQSNTSLGNNDPKHPTKEISVKVLDPNRDVVREFKGDVSFSQSTGDFRGTVVLDSPLDAGQYYIQVTADRYLSAEIPGLRNISENNSFNPLTLITGDILDDDELNILDYNILLDCGYGSPNPLPMDDPNSAYNSPECTSHEFRQNADLDDDGAVDQIDYNIFVRNITTLSGD